MLRCRCGRHIDDDSHGAVRNEPNDGTRQHARATLVCITPHGSWCSRRYALHLLLFGGSVSTGGGTQRAPFSPLLRHLCLRGISLDHDLQALLAQGGNAPGEVLRRLLACLDARRALIDALCAPKVAAAVTNVAIDERMELGVIVPDKLEEGRVGSPELPQEGVHQLWLPPRHRDQLHELRLGEHATARMEGGDRILLVSDRSRMPRDCVHYRIRRHHLLASAPPTDWRARIACAWRRG